MKTEVLISDGKEYSVRKARELAEDKLVRTIKTSLLPRTRIQHKGRVDKADTDIPIILSKDDSGLIVVDGQHRIRKARQLGRGKIGYRYLSQKELEEARQPRSTYFCRKCKGWHHKGTKVFQKHRVD